MNALTWPRLIPLANLLHRYSKDFHLTDTTRPQNAPDFSAVITQLYVYPVKSCAGVAVKEAYLTETGLDLDRAWMVVD